MIPSLMERKAGADEAVVSLSADVWKRAMQIHHSSGALIVATTKSKHGIKE